LPVVCAKIATVTLGCKVNQVDTAILLDNLALLARDYDIDVERVGEKEEADIYLVNTCSVTASTDSQCRKTISKLHRLNPKGKIIVTGCYCFHGREKLASIPGVSAVVTNRDKDLLPYFCIQAILPEHEKKESLEKNKSGKYFQRAVGGILTAGHTRPFIKVQDGCDSFCSYCIVPLTRGPCRSVSSIQVLEQIEKLKSYHELVLTGIHLGKYGIDLPEPIDLADLLQMICLQGKCKRLRLSSIEPNEFDTHLLDLISGNPVICRHLHIPLQSGDDNILTAMNRQYTVSTFINVIEKIMALMPDLNLGLDVMVGFPGEGEREFNNTVKLLEQIPFCYLHVFPFSPRPGTRAARFTAQVDPKEKKRRSNILLTLGEKKYKAFLERQRGISEEILLEGTDKSGKYYQGFSRRYIKSLVPRDKLLFLDKLGEYGTIVKGRFERFTKSGMVVDSATQ